MTDRQNARPCESDRDGDVLVVEDDPEINELVGAYVRIAGFGYRCALSGGDALHQARLWNPQLIVLDLMLPDLDGCEVCRRLKAEPATAGIPVMMLTAMDKEAMREACLACGVIAYLTKPFDPDELIAAIRENAKVSGKWAVGSGQ